MWKFKKKLTLSQQTVLNVHKFVLTWSLSRLNFWDTGSTASTFKLRIWSKSIRIKGPWQDLKLPMVRQSWDEGIWEISSLSRYLEVMEKKNKMLKKKPTINTDACTQYTLPSWRGNTLSTRSLETSEKMQMDLTGRQLPSLFNRLAQTSTKTRECIKKNGKPTLF